MGGTGIVPQDNSGGSVTNIHSRKSLVTFRLGKQLYGLPIFKVRDILAYKELSRVPLSSKEVLGVINIRGKIVTVLDLRQKLNLIPVENYETGLCLIIEAEGSTYGLRVDAVGDILEVSEDVFEAAPPKLSHLKHVLSGVYRLSGDLLMLLDLKGVLSRPGDDDDLLEVSH